MEEAKLGTNYRTNAAVPIAAVTIVAIRAGLQPYDTMLAEIIRRRRGNRVIEASSSLGDVKNVPDAKFHMGRGGERAGEELRSLPMRPFRNGFSETSRKLYRPIKVLLLGYLIAGEAEYAYGRLRRQ